MSHALTRARRDRANRPRHLLARILEMPHLPAEVQALPAYALAELIDHVGLEDAGEIVALATTEQLTHVFDEDLWQSERAGEDERFDAARFLVWLEVMLEAGEGFVAERIAELQEDLVALAFHSHLLVLDLDALRDEMLAMDEDERAPVDNALEYGLYEEIDAYRVIGRRSDGWDALLTALLALDREHHDILARILERCCHMSTEYIDENGGLYQVLTSEEMLAEDVAGQREDRRAEEGYVAPSSAAAFLKLAKQPIAVSDTSRDPLTRAYFARLRPTGRAPIARPHAASERPAGLTEVLLQAGVIESGAPPLLSASEASDHEPLLVRAMRQLADESSELFATRSEELAYLANVLVAGWTSGGRRLRPIEAVRTVIEACSEGIAIACDATGREPAACLRAQPADVLFRLAWSRRDSDERVQEARTGTQLTSSSTSES